MNFRIATTPFWIGNRKKLIQSKCDQSAIWSQSNANLWWLGPNFADHTSFHFLPLILKSISKSLNHKFPLHFNREQLSAVVVLGMVFLYFLLFILQQWFFIFISSETLPIQCWLLSVLKIASEICWVSALLSQLKIYF